jgi:sterol desaturase/sphingolipid hydroxylase (fatty acid hydroxylase superfamily)
VVNCYHHVVEEILRLPLMILPMTLLIKVDVPRVVVTSTILGFFGLFIHTNTCLPFGPLRYLFGVPSRFVLELSWARFPA